MGVLDTARCKVEMTPLVVQNVLEPDGDTVNQFHHDIKKTLGGKLEYTKIDANDKWYYATARDISSETTVIAGGFTDGSALIDAADKVRFLYVNHTGKDDADEDTNKSLYITFDGGTPGPTTGDAIIISNKEAIVLKFTNLVVSDLKAAAQTGTIRVIVVAILDDVSAGGGGGG